MSSFCYYCILLISFFHFCLPTQNFNHILCQDVERQALLRFKHGLVDPTNKLASWVGEDKECCSWVGIVCDNVTGHVHQIHLRGGVDGYCYHDYDTEDNLASSQMLGGDLSSSLLHLKQLRHLDLSCNDFAGMQVPRFMGSLGNLRYLNLSGSTFGGIIPPQLGNLSKLQVLSLGSFYDPEREYTSLVNMQWLSSLHLLHHLDMSGVDLSKAIDWFQVINTLPSLAELHLSGCQLSHSHPIFQGPTSIDTFRNLTSLKLLHVSGNNFMSSSLVLKGLSSTIGGNLISLDISICGISSLGLVSLHNLTSLLNLDLSVNKLNKAIPKALGNLCKLREIDLSGNNFQNISLTRLLSGFFECKSPSLESLYLSHSKVSGNLPDQFAQLLNLVYLVFGSNNIVGVIPNWIGKLAFLRFLSLYSNLFSGPIPYSIGRLSSLEGLYLSNNQLNGSLPESLGQLSKLKSLDLSSNLLTGAVTEVHFAKLTKLKYLSGEGNNLIFRPQLANWIPPFRLQSLYLNSWRLGPRFPLWLQSQMDLSYLEISNTNISATMPHSFWKLFPNLVHLDMAYNHIQGTLFNIPATLDTLNLGSNEFTGLLPVLSNSSRLQFLDLSNNFFVGLIDRLLCPYEETPMQLLNLGNNNLSGDIPECWDKWRSLYILNLENNNLSGEIPKTLGISSNLESLNMRGNNLSGRLPNSLMNLTRLQFLQLGRNELVGSIPTWLGRELSDLRSLGLRSNNFDGNIPQELCYLTNIHILDLAQNKLVGNIPRCFNNFTGLSRKEKDPIVSYTVYANRSADFVISELLVMKGREDMYKSFLGLVKMMDLSSNKFSGQIPSELTALRELKSLNLSRNQLTGKIPEKIGDMNSLESFDLSLNKLSGELPVSLSSLSFLSSFNVSSNSFTGRIPSGTQLQSLNESSFFGNNLCGDPLNERCVVEAHDRDQKEEVKDGSHGPDWGLIISTVFGLVIGFWIIVAPLIFSRSWRIAYFRFLTGLGSWLMISYVLFHFCLSAQNSNRVLCKDVERRALFDFKHDLIDRTDKLASWVGEDKECCHWAGIVCDNVTGHVHRIHLRGLDGHCSVEDYPTAREYKEVAKQSFGWIEIPSFIGSLENLRYLNLSSSVFSGTIPPQLGNLSNLEVLGLGSFYDNSYEYTTMPNMKWLSRLRSLHHLDLSGIDLSGSFDWLQVMNTLPSLVELHLSNCQLSHVHPHVPSLNLTSLSLLDLSRNTFDNSFVPRWIFSITSLVSLDLSSCGFSGPTPGSTDSFCNLTSLKFLHIPGNDLMNSSLKGLSSVGGNLISLDISFCGVSSSDLVALRNLTSLLSLDLSNNQLIEAIPKSLGNICNLKEIDLSHNDFRNVSLTYLLEGLFECKSPSLESLSLRSSGLSVRLPDQLARLKHLVYLDLGKNDIVGMIPDSIGRLSFLRFLYLHSNQVSGPIPYSIGRLSELEELNLAHNQLNGSLPDSLGQLSKLVHLHFSDNLLTGFVTEAHLAKLVSLKFLSGEGNNLTFGPKLSNWIPPFRLQSLTITLSFKCFKAKLLGLSNNFFEGSLDHLLCPYDEKQVEVLDLGKNRLSGVIPECWKKWQELEFLNLENNNLSGEIPRTFGSLSHLQWLNMHGNKLSGRLPESLKYLRNLKILQLGSNELDGSIPSWFKRLHSFLGILDLRSNNFDGNIPEELCSLTKIQILDLAHNNLSGNIPRCFRNLSVLSGEVRNTNIFKFFTIEIKMAYASESLMMKGREDVYNTILPLVMMMDLSGNNFVGEIPSELTVLRGLKSLNLSRKQLTGRIPEKIGDLKALESLDLSSNKLSGELPMSLSSLSFLSSFNVSDNGFTGRIPSSTQLQSLNESSFFGNNLCGDPLTERCEAEAPNTNREEEEDGADWGLIISTVTGLVVGFWIIMAPLIVSRSWRIAYFRFLIRMGYRIYDVMHKHCCTCSFK
ncbi:hypothetical protein OSB04_027134 [Centaurea solstitialis]|uniref:Leucine-rich repeat-containing N-terminal plant-type domain-containing protein n=1 Tax=Centaurea solstitialis TaxID=347529 RepID=A0AA38SE15_9ASTR|nr:hypothetical protein OSB04_027134 [Centaurea solstitialis]